MELLALVLALFVAAGAAPFATRVLGRHSGRVLALAPLAAFLFLARHVPDVAGGRVVRESVAWLPALEVQASFLLDGLGLLMGLLILGIGALVVLYAGRYLEGHAHLGRFFLFLLLFMASMLGLVLADDLIVLFVFWELTSVTSFLLIGFSHADKASRAAAWQALVVTAGGGLALLAGIILLGVAGGTFQSSVLNTMGPALQEHSLYLPALLLVLLGAFTKSAQFPFHFWLPNAMAAPTPVSAYLHSATMVKAGVFLLARLHPALSGPAAWVWIVSLFGAATFVVGAVLAVRQSDLKRILAYSTVSALGALTLLLGIGTPKAVQAAMVFLLAHALYKGCLFLVAGAVDHGTGSRDVERLSGLGRAMPFTAAAGVVAAASFAGLPPLFGFVGKEFFLGALFEAPASPLFVAAGAVGAVLLVVAAFVVGVRPFVGRPAATPHEPHEAPWDLLAGPVLLASAGLLLGLVPVVAEPLMEAASASVHGAPTGLHLVLWHGVDAALVVGVVALVVGLLLALAAPRLRRALSGPVDAASRWGPEKGYAVSVAGMLGAAEWQTRLLQHGRLRAYLGTSAVVVLVGAAVALLRPGVWGVWPDWTPVQAHEALLVLAMVLGAFYVCLTSSRLAAVAALGVVGYAVAVLFLLFGAPDLAMTQFLFETLSVLLFVMVLARMPRLVPRSPRSTRLRDAFIAGAFGLVMMMLALAVMGVRVHDPVSTFFAENSYLLAHGRNVVNVILVDFRGLDTLGEVVVIVVAAVGVHALLKARGSKPPVEPAQDSVEAEP